MSIESAAAEVSAVIGSFPDPERGQARFLITAGPTAEDIDAVRFLTNRSTGRMGMAIAETARRRGHQVLLLLGPTPLDAPDDVPTVRVRSAREMQAAVQAAFDWCDALIMSAAVADYQPAEIHEGKLHKDKDELLLRLVRTPDILEGLIEMHSDQVMVGFSLDTVIDPAAATEKRDRKGLDIIVANTQHAFGGVSTDAVVLERGREAEPIRGTKDDLAETLIERCEDRARRIRARRSASDRFAARRDVLPE